MGHQGREYAPASTEKGKLSGPSKLINVRVNWEKTPQDPDYREKESNHEDQPKG